MFIYVTKRSEQISYVYRNRLILLLLYDIYLLLRFYLHNKQQLSPEASKILLSDDKQGVISFPFRFTFGLL